jgi:hypothetical protein
MILSVIVLSQSQLFFANTKELSIAITLDLVLTTPLVYYFLIRKKDIPKFTVVTFFTVGILIANIIIPKEQQETLNFVESVLFPLVELLIITFLFLKARKVVLEFRKKKNQSVDFYDAIKYSCLEIFPVKIAHVVATEVAMFYYLLFNWKKKVLSKNEYSYYKESGLISLLLGIVLVLVIETVALHVFLIKWNALVAWFLTALSIYTTLQILSLIRSLNKRPIIFDKEKRKLLLRYGFFAEENISLDEILKVEVSSKDLPEDKSIVRFSPLGELEGHNIIIHLKNENSFRSLYGFSKKYTSIAFTVDKKQELKKVLEETLSQ